MDVEARVGLVQRAPTEEVVTQEELASLFETNDSPRHYIGLEISGPLHLGSLISTGYKINDFAEAGCRCTIFLADWHTLLNDKLEGSEEAIKRVSQYYTKAFGLVCPKAEIVLGSNLYEQHRGYWRDLARLTKHMSLARTMRTLTIMGRSESENIDLAKLLYPPMQAADIHTLDVDIAHSGMDQRKIHMLAREVFPKLGWKVPISVHQSLLPGLSGPSGGASGKATAAKMSKSVPDSGIFIHDTDEQIRAKINKAWCDPGAVEGNALLAIAGQIIFRDSAELKIERPEKFGGDVSYTSYAGLESDYAAKKLHAADLKAGIAEAVIGVVAPVRDALGVDKELIKQISQS